MILYSILSVTGVVIFNVHKEVVSLLGKIKDFTHCNRGGPGVPPFLVQENYFS